MSATATAPGTNGAAPRASKPRASTKAARRAAVTDAMTGMQLLGEVITWRSAGPHTHAAVVAALSAAGLDPKVARERLPRHAFSRACRRLADERVIDELRDDKDELTFQFSRRHLVKDAAGEEEIAYRKEVKVVLNKTTGVIACPDPAVRERAQAELDRCLAERTAGDLTNIVQRLFERHADLVPVRDQGGVYFVPQEHAGFVAQVRAFLEKLGGGVRSFPVPAGTQHGDRSVQESLAEYLEGLVGDHRRAVEGFTLQTRADTIQDAADRINRARAKVEAYATYLSDRRDALLAAVDAANAELAARIERLETDRKGAPPAEHRGSKDAVYQMWKDAGGRADPDACHAAVGGAVQLSTIKSWFGAWKRGTNLPARAGKGQP